VVDTCVNLVGVNLNTASHHLLSHVSGLGPALARAIVEHRERQGLFRSRQQLLDLPRFTRKTFEQAAGFLRIPGGEHSLDNTGVHPERYGTIETLAARLNKSVSDLLGQGAELLRGESALKEEIGGFTFEDILVELARPGRDPRESFVPFAFREDIREVADLKAGMVCPGVVTNVTNFGAFVDIGVHHDGLVHISQLARRFVQDPREVVKPSDHVQVRIVSVDLDKNQIFLTMKAPEPDEKQPKRPKRPADRASAASARATRAPAVRRPEAPPHAVSASTRKSRPAPSKRPAEHQRPKAPPRPAFNNPFAVLANLQLPKSRTRS
jgi:uncharacterized protein